jgi:hypothetical protein
MLDGPCWSGFNTQKHQQLSTIESGERTPLSYRMPLDQVLMVEIRAKCMLANTTAMWNDTNVVTQARQLV